MMENSLQAFKAPGRRLAAFAILVALVTVLGCGPKRIAISGRVTLDGQPLDEAALQFIPTSPGQRKSSCEVNAGVYTLPAEIGLVPGEYRVDVVDLPPLSHSPAARRSFPAHYANHSPLTIEVEPDGPRVFDFELRSSP